MKKIVKAIFRLFPFPIRDYIQRKIFLNWRKKIITEWIAKDKPIPPPHAIKQIAVEEFQIKFNYNILIETGTFQGDMVEAQRRNFEKIYSIELSEKLFNECKRKFSRFNHINLYRGDSSMVLPSLMKEIFLPAIFWLDGHYSGGITMAGEKNCPINEEINAIFSSPLDHIILVDDAKDFIGKNDYPTIDALKESIMLFRPNYLFEIKDNIIRAFPK